MELWNTTLEDGVGPENTARVHNLSSLSSDSWSTITPTSLPAIVSRNDVWPWRNGLFGVGGACIACVGVVCNCIAIVVLMRFKNSQCRSSAPLLLIFLEVSDTIFLLFELFLENMVYMAQGGVVTRQYLTFIKPIYCVSFTVPHIARTCSTFFVVVITVERYVVVARPMAVHTICRSFNVKLAAVFVLTLAFVYHLPVYLAYRCPRKWNNATQTEDIHFGRTEFGSSYYFINVHMTWLQLCVSFLVPFLFLLTFNTLLLRVLWQGNSVLVDANQRRARHENKLTAMVLSMTVIFFLCELLSAVSFILTSGLNSFTQCSLHCVRLTAVTDTFVIVNAAANFAIYCASGRKFREIFAQIFLRRPSQAFVSSLSGSRSSSRTKVSLKKFVSENVQTSLVPNDVQSSDIKSTHHHLSVVARSSNSLLDQHGGMS